MELMEICSQSAKSMQSEYQRKQHVSGEAIRSFIVSTMLGYHNLNPFERGVIVFARKIEHSRSDEI